MRDLRKFENEELKRVLLEVVELELKKGWVDIELEDLVVVIDDDLSYLDISSKEDIEECCEEGESLFKIYDLVVDRVGESYKCRDYVVVVGM